MSIQISHNGTCFHTTIGRYEHEARGVIKRAGFRFHWGDHRCYNGCLGCKAKLEPMTWWSTDADGAAKLREHLDDKARAVVDSAMDAFVESRATDAVVDAPAPAGLSYLPYQRAGIAWMSKRPNTLLGDEMGLGKTIQVLGLINLDQSIRRVLVVCPASLRLNWAREASKWMVRGTNCVVANKASDVPVYRYDEHGELCFDGAEVTIVIVNYERLITSIKGKGKDREEVERGEGLWGELMKRSWDLVVVDEAHRVKNPRAKQSRRVLGETIGRGRTARKVPGLLAQANRVALLTGTPIANRPKELWPLVHALDEVQFGNFFKYGLRYCDGHQVNIGRKTIWDFSGATNLDELQRKLRSSIMIRRLKADVLTELPPKRRHLHVLPANGATKVVEKERNAYEGSQEAVDVARGELEVARASGNERALQDAVASLAEANGIAFEAISAHRADLGTAKVKPAADHIIELLEGGLQKLVVFAHHKHVIAGLVSALKEYSPVSLTGETRMDDRQAAVDRFQQDPSCRVFCGNIQAAGVGLTLTAASTVVFVEADWVPASLTQAEDRCHRIGQKDYVVVQYLVFDGSLDQIMLEKIIDKMDVADRALDKPPATDTYSLDSLDPLLNKSEAKDAKKQEQRRRAFTYDEEKVAAVLSGMRHLAARCDGARMLDNQGFSGSWVRFGHWFAQLDQPPTDKQVDIAIRCLVYHKRQVPHVLDMLKQKGWIK